MLSPSEDVHIQYKRMLQWLVGWFMIYMSLVSEVRCTLADEWDIYTVDSLDLAMDFDNGQKLGTNCSNMVFEFEVDWDELLKYATPITTNNEEPVWGHFDSEKPRKVLLITLCTAVAVLVAVLLFIYGKKALITYLQSGTYNVQQYNRVETTFQELPEVAFRNN